jgi:hypothetical protein
MCSVVAIGSGGAAMHRALVVLGIGFGLVTSLAPAAAGAPKVSVTDTEKVNGEIVITATDCRSSGYTAELDVYITRPDDTFYSMSTHPTDPSGTTNIPIKMTEAGSFTVSVTCRHVGVGIWYTEREEVEILTALEYITKVDLRERQRKSDRELGFDMLLIFVGGPPPQRGSSSSTAVSQFVGYEIDGKAPLGNKSGRVPADADGETVVKLKIKGSYKPGTYTVTGSFIEVSDAGAESLLGQAADTVKLKSKHIP